MISSRCRLLMVKAENQMLTRAPLPDDAPLGCYIHIPFCTRICPYCDFTVYRARGAPIEQYVDAVIRELTLTAEHYGCLPIATVYFGGGTPSLLPPQTVGNILDTVARYFQLLPGAEISLEANPESAQVENLRGYRAAGVNRLSIGVQSFQRRGLKILGRAHTPETPRQAVQAARAAGFANVNLDFIYGWPGQTLAEWADDLAQALALEPEHLSLYALTIEPGTPFARGVARGVIRPLDDDTVADFAELAIDRLATAGWEQYEISNWASEPQFRSRHNQLYWQNGRYLGIGVGAHGYLGTVRYRNTRRLDRYIAMLAEGRLPVAEQEEIDHQTAMAETMMLGLRLVQDGVDAAAFAVRHGSALESVYGPVLHELAELGLLEWDGRCARLTRRGILLANEVAVHFLPEQLPTAVATSARGSSSEKQPV